MRHVAGHVDGRWCCCDVPSPEQSRCRCVATTTSSGTIRHCESAAPGGKPGSESRRTIPHSSPTFKQSQLGGRDSEHRTPRVRLHRSPPVSHQPSLHPDMRLRARPGRLHGQTLPSMRNAAEEAKQPSEGRPACWSAFTGMMARIRRPRQWLRRYPERERGPRRRRQRQKQPFRSLFRLNLRV